MTNQEALLIRSYFSNVRIDLSTRNNKIGAIRRFLMWERDESKKISFDDMFLIIWFSMKSHQRLMAKLFLTIIWE